MFSFKSSLFILVAAFLVAVAHAIPHRRGVGYNQYSAGVAGGGYAHTSGGSIGGYSNRRPVHVEPPGFYQPVRGGGGHNSGYNNREITASGGFVAGGGTVHASSEKGHKNRGFGYGK